MWQKKDGKKYGIKKQRNGKRNNESEVGGTQEENREKGIKGGREGERETMGLALKLDSCP